MDRNRFGSGVMMVFVGIVLLIVFALQGIIRLSPTSNERWHVDPFTAADPELAGFVTIVETGLSVQEAQVRILNEAETEPRTKRIAKEESDTDVFWRTYRTRSAFWGFPDYTSVQIRSVDGRTQVAFLARLRFGRSDFDVNEKRVNSWVKAAGL